MNSSLFIPSMNPDKLLDTDIIHLGWEVKHTVQSLKNSVYLTWMIPTSFLTIEPKLSLIWLSLNDNPIKLDFELTYKYYNKESVLGYFTDDGMPVVTYDNGNSETYTATLETENMAEKDIVQKTLPYNLVKKDRRSGTLVCMEVTANPAIDEVYLMGTEIRYTDEPRIREPVGRKRTHKQKWDEDDYYDSWR